MAGERGLTLIEVLASMMIGAIALTAYIQTVKPTIAGNVANRKQIDIVGALAEVLDSAMTQPVTVLDGMHNQVYKSRQGVQVLLTVTAPSQAETDLILTGLDISRLRKLRVRAVSDTSRFLTATVSNYQEISTGKCFTQ